MNAPLVLLRNPGKPPAEDAAAQREAPSDRVGADTPVRMYTAYGAAAIAAKPHSHVTTYDLNARTIERQVPDGEAVGVEPVGNFGTIKDHGPKARLVVTAGGLIFHATIERKIRADVKDTVKVLWALPLSDGSSGFSGRCTTGRNA